MSRRIWCRECKFLEDNPLSTNYWCAKLKIEVIKSAEPSHLGLPITPHDCRGGEPE
jgi:hypothetical protein